MALMNLFSTLNVRARGNNHCVRRFYNFINKIGELRVVHENIRVENDFFRVV